MCRLMVLPACINVFNMGLLCYSALSNRLDVKGMEAFPEDYLGLPLFGYTH